jgi:hypothetical protein
LRWACLPPALLWRSFRSLSVLRVGHQTGLERASLVFEADWSAGVFEDPPSVPDGRLLVWLLSRISHNKPANSAFSIINQRNEQAVYRPLLSQFTAHVTLYFSLTSFQHQPSASSHNKSAPAISHQPAERGQGVAPLTKVPSRGECSTP